MSNEYGKATTVNSRNGARTLIKGKTTWFWDSLMNQDHLTVRIAKHQDVMSNKPTNFYTSIGQGKPGIELLRGFLTRDITFSATNEWGEAKDTLREVTASKTGVDPGSWFNSEKIASTLMTIGDVVTGAMNLVGWDEKGIEKMDNAFRENIKASSYKMVNYAEAAKTYQGTAINFPNTLSVLLIADEYDKDPRAALHGVLGDFLGIPVANLTRNVEQNAIDEVRGSVSYKVAVPEDVKSSTGEALVSARNNENAQKKVLDIAKQTLNQLEDPSWFSTFVNGSEATQGGRSFEGMDKETAIAKAKLDVQMAESGLKMAQAAVKSLNGKVDAKEKKSIDAAFSADLSIKSPKTAQNGTTANTKSTPMGKLMDGAMFLKNFFTQGQYEFMGPPGGYFYDPEATRNNKAHAGTISLFISNHMVIHNLLVANVDIDVSQFVTTQGYPLWVRADISFVPAALFTSRDIARALGGTGRIYGLYDEDLADENTNMSGRKQWMGGVRLWEKNKQVSNSSVHEEDVYKQWYNLGITKEKGIGSPFKDWGIKRNPDNQNFRVVIVNEKKNLADEYINEAKALLKANTNIFDSHTALTEGGLKGALANTSTVTKNAMNKINSAHQLDPGFKSLTSAQMNGFNAKMDLKRKELEAPLFNLAGLQYKRDS